MVTPRVLFAQFGSVLRPLTGCPYIALLEAICETCDDLV